MKLQKHESITSPEDLVLVVLLTLPQKPEKQGLQQGLARFYKVRTADPQPEDGMVELDTDRYKELWIMRFASNTTGMTLQRRLMVLHQYDTLEKLNMEVRADRAPKGGIQRALEEALSLIMPKKEDKSKAGKK